MRIEDFKGSNANELYTLLLIVGRDPNGIQYRSLVEKFLDYPKEPMLSRLALKTVCNYWGLTKNYLGTVKSFVKGVSWDDSEDIRLVAISTSGEYLRETIDKELLQQILEVYENLHESPLVRSSAFEALLRTIGMDWNEIPSVGDLFEHLEDYESPLLIEKVKKLIQS